MAKYKTKLAYMRTCETGNRRQKCDAFHEPFAEFISEIVKFILGTAEPGYIHSKQRFIVVLFGWQLGHR